MKTASCQPCEGCFQKETQAGDRQRSGGEKYNADGNRGENEKAGKQRGDKGGGDEDISVVALQSASCSPASHKLGFSMRTTLVQMAILVLVLGVCNVAGQEPELEPELLQTKPIYTGLLRTIGGTIVLLHTRSVTPDTDISSATSRWDQSRCELRPERSQTDAQDVHAGRGSWKEVASLLSAPCYLRR